MPGGRWPSSRSTACRRCCRSIGPSCATRPSPASRSACTRGGSRQSSPRTSRPTQAARRGGTAAADGEPEPRERITVEVGGKRLEVTVPAGLGATAGGRGAAGGRGTCASGGRRRAAPRWCGGRRAERRRAREPDAGHDRQDRRRRRRAGRDRRHHRCARGDEDGAAADRAQGRHVTGLSISVGQTVPAGAVICQLR